MFWSWNVLAPVHSRHYWLNRELDQSILEDPNRDLICPSKFHKIYRIIIKIDALHSYHNAIATPRRGIHVDRPIQDSPRSDPLSKPHLRRHRQRVASFRGPKRTYRSLHLLPPVSLKVAPTGPPAAPPPLAPFAMAPPEIINLVSDSDDDEPLNIRPRRVLARVHDPVPDVDALPNVPQPPVDDDEIVFVSHVQTSTRTKKRKVVALECGDVVEETTSNANPPTEAAGNANPASTAAPAGDDDIAVVGVSKGTSALADFAHARYMCEKKPFAVDPMQFCDQCYCYVCDDKASACPDWASHCRATATKAWKAKRTALARRVAAAPRGGQTSMQQFLSRGHRGRGRGRKRAPSVARGRAPAVGRSSTAAGRASNTGPRVLNGPARRGRAASGLVAPSVSAAAASLAQPHWDDDAALAQIRDSLVMRSSYSAAPLAGSIVAQAAAAARRAAELTAQGAAAEFAAAQPSTEVTLQERMAALRARRLALEARLEAEKQRDIPQAGSLTVTSDQNATPTGAQVSSTLPVASAGMSPATPAGAPSATGINIHARREPASAETSDSDTERPAKRSQVRRPARGGNANRKQ